MREISTHFAIIPEQLVKTSVLMGENIALPSGSGEFQCTGKIIFDQTPGDSSDGTVWTQTFRAVTTDRGVLDYNGARAYVGVIFSDGSMAVIGGAFGLPVIRVNSNAQAYVVETTFQTPLPIEL